MNVKRGWVTNGLKPFCISALVAFSLSLSACNPTAQNSSGAAESSASPDSPSNSGDTLGINSLMEALRNLIGNPGNSNERREPSGRVCTTDSYQQPSAPNFSKVDILFLQDTSGSMRDEWRRVAGNVQHLIAQIPNGVDVRVGVMLAHVGQRSGQLFAASGQPRVLSNQNLSNVQIGNSLFATFEAGIQTTDPALGEAAFYSLNEAITARLRENQNAGFFRPDALLAVVFMSDENEISVWPASQAPGLPKRCDETWEDRFKREYYDPRGLTVDRVVSRLKTLKGEVPLSMHALVNITREDLFRRNDPNASCLYDSLGYGYFDIIRKTQGVLWSIQDDRTEGMIRIGRHVGDGLDLIKDFRLSKPAEKVDPATIKARVDTRSVTHRYDRTSNLVRLDNAGSFGSKIQIDHCDFAPIADWRIEGFQGVPTFNSVTLSWKTPGRDAKGVLRVGLSPTKLDLRTVSLPEFMMNQSALVGGLASKTTYYFQAVATDKSGATRTSEIIAVTTLEEPILWRIEDFTGTTTHNSATLTWKTPGEETRAILKVGLSPTELTLPSIPVTQYKVAQEQLVSGLSPNTTYYFQVEAEDRKARKVSSAVITLRTKEEPPREWAVVGFDATTTIDTALLFWQTQDIPTKAKVKVGMTADNLTLQTINIDEFKAAHQMTVTGLTPDTMYFFQVEATDAIGRTRMSPVISKRTKPDPITWSIQGFQGVPTFNSVNMSWNTGAEATKAVLRVGLAADNLSLREIPIAEFATSQSVLVSGLNELTTYFFQVTAFDRRGRSVQSPIISVKTLEEPIRWQINNLAGAPTFNSVNLSWNTGSELTRAMVRVGLSSVDLTFREISIAEFMGNHSVLVGGLTELTDYFFQVTAFDRRGRPVVSPVISVKTLEEPIRWQINNLVGVPTFNSVALTWNTGNEDTRAVVKVGLSADNLSLREINIPAFLKNQAASIEGLTELTSYFIQVTAFDRRGRPVVSPIISVRTLEEPIRWQINNLAGVPTFNSVDLGWDTGAELTKAVVRVGLTESNLNFRQVNIEAFSTAHRTTIAGLTELNTYFFQVTALDRRGRPVVSPIISVKTLEEPIRWQINNLAGVPTYNSVELTWNTGNEDTRAVVKVGLSAADLSFREVSLPNFAKSQAISIEGLTELTDYFFQVTAFDRRGRPVVSPVISVKTLEEPIRWQINNLSGLPSYDRVTVSWNTGAELTRGVLRVGLSANDLTLKEFNIEEFATSHSRVVDGLTELTTYFFQVTALDRRGRPVVSPIISVKTLEEPIRWQINNLVGVSNAYDTVNLSWDTGAELTRAVVRVGLSANDLSFRQISVAEFSTSQAVLVAGLTELTDYFFQVTAFDRRNRPVVSPVISVKTQEEPIRWQINNLAGTTSWDRATITYNTGTEATRAVIRVGLNPDALDFKEVAFPALTAQHSHLITGLSELTGYYFQVTAFDRRNRPVVSPVIQLRTLEEPINWQINNLAGTAEWNRAQISWNTGSEQTRAVLKVGLSATDLNFREIAIADFSTSKSQLVDGLSELTSYFFQVTAYDRRNRPVTSPVIELRTPVEPILWNIQGISANPSFSIATIAWNTGAEPTRGVLNIGTSAGDLSREVSVANLATSQSVEVNGLIPNTQYFYRVSAFDARNRQRQSSILSFTTPEQTWTVAGLDATTTATAIKIIWQTQNVMTVGKVRLGLMADNLTLVEASVTEFRNSHLIDVTGLAPNTRYFMQVEATDREGRRLFSNIISKVTKAAVAPTIAPDLGLATNR
jgi:chitodextrinase